ncbi:iron-containing alcohol dehydrogenase [Desulforamulus putei]|uniref:iron-containing alcohol dehydrogenase n=1 Tax=Desulforamulus putei TaxID=74701 RepID=UPI002FDE5E4F
MKYFRVPSDIVFGWGSLSYLKEIKGKRAFIVTDSTIQKLGYVEKVESYLKEAGLATKVFAEVEPDPSRDTVDKGVKIMNEFQPDWIVGLGGGSSIDAAKGMWVKYEYPNLTWDEVFGELPPLRQKARFIAIATTSGTGSEVTCAAVITNRSVEPHVKNVIAGNEITPDIAITDPELASNMPPKVTAATGMDVLTHAIESYTSIAATEIDKAIAIRAIQMVFRSLPKAYADGRNKAAREDMHTASLMAGMAFTNSFLGIVHSLAHQLGSQYGIPHGLANSLMLPYVIEYNSIAVSELYAEIASALKIDFENNRDAVNKLVQAIYQLQTDIGQPHTIKDAGVDEKTFFDRLEITAQNALNDICTYCNPRVPNIQDMKNLYTTAYYGKDSK